MNYPVSTWPLTSAGNLYQVTKIHTQITENRDNFTGTFFIGQLSPATSSRHFNFLLAKKPRLKLCHKLSFATAVNSLLALMCFGMIHNSPSSLFITNVHVTEWNYWSFHICLSKHHCMPPLKNQREPNKLLSKHSIHRCVFGLGECMKMLDFKHQLTHWQATFSQSLFHHIQRGTQTLYSWTQSDMYACNGS